MLKSSANLAVYIELKVEVAKIKSLQSICDREATSLRDTRFDYHKIKLWICAALYKCSIFQVIFQDEVVERVPVEDGETAQ